MQETNLVGDKTKTIIHLEDEYPLHDRRAEGWKLIGFHNDAKPSAKKIVNGTYPYGKVPVWRYLGWDLNKKYDGAALREIRERNGVGSPKKRKK